MNNNVFKQPSLNRSAGNNSNEDETKTVDTRLPIHKHALILDYLHKISINNAGSTTATEVTYIDIYRELGIDMKDEIEVLSMLQSNPRVECKRIENSSEVDFAFKYLSKHVIMDKRELLLKINQIKSGISLADIQDCYNGIVDDVMNAIVGGDIIAIKNKGTKELILYPRGVPFLCRLGGKIRAKRGHNMISIDNPKEDLSLTSEIRRGEAIGIADSWYRVSCAVTAIANNNAVGVTPTVSSNTPSTVSLDKDLVLNTSKHVYVDQFTESELPLDGVFEADDINFEDSIQAVRHGCTTDVKDLWNSTMEQLNPFKIVSLTNNNNDSVKLLDNELVRLNLVTKSATMQSNTINASKTFEANPKKKVRKVSQVNTNKSVTAVHNSHLNGTDLGKILQETASGLMESKYAAAVAANQQ